MLRGLPGRLDAPPCTRAGTADAAGPFAAGAAAPPVAGTWGRMLSVVGTGAGTAPGLAQASPEGKGTPPGRSGSPVGLLRLGGGAAEPGAGCAPARAWLLAWAMRASVRGMSVSLTRP